MREYYQELSVRQSQTADKPMTPQGRATQQSRDTMKTNQAKQPTLSSPSRWSVAKLECTQNNAQQNIEQLQNNTLGVTINNE